MQFSSKLGGIQQNQKCHCIQHDKYILKYDYVYLRSMRTVFITIRKKSLASIFWTPVYRKIKNAPTRSYEIFASRFQRSAIMILCSNWETHIFVAYYFVASGVVIIIIAIIQLCLFFLYNFCTAMRLYS